MQGEETCRHPNKGHPTELRRDDGSRDSWPRQSLSSQKEVSNGSLLPPHTMTDPGTEHEVGQEHPPVDQSEEFVNRFVGHGFGSSGDAANLARTLFLFCRTSFRPQTLKTASGNAVEQSPGLLGSYAQPFLAFHRAISNIRIQRFELAEPRQKKACQICF